MSSCVSGSTPAFSDSTKVQVQLIGHGRCFNCSSTPVDVCHVVARSDAAVDFLSQQNLLNFDLASSSNAIALCLTCHSNYDLDHDPGLTIIPDDLSFFVSFETSDYNERVCAAEMGIVKPRTCPTIEEYRDHLAKQGRVSSESIGGLYRRLLLKDFQPIIPLSYFSDPKPWHGAPLAIIRHAFTALGTVRIHRWPSNDLSLLTELRSLYARPPPLVEGRKSPSDVHLCIPSAKPQEGGTKWGFTSSGEEMDNIQDSQRPENSVLGPSKSSFDAMKYFAPHILSTTDSHDDDPLHLCSSPPEPHSEEEDD